MQTIETFVSKFSFFFLPFFYSYQINVYLKCSAHDKCLSVTRNESARLKKKKKSIVASGKMSSTLLLLLLMSKKKQIVNKQKNLCSYFQWQNLTKIQPHNCNEIYRSDGTVYMILAPQINLLFIFCLNCNR